MLQPDPIYLTRARPRAVAWWLLAVAALVVAMIAIGGITRLTESGLSITQWKPISGTLPPLTDAAWAAEFAHYRQIPQYAAFNAGMTMAGFKAIFFWEYLHRLLGRVIGLAVALPLAWFALRRRIPRGYGWRLVALLALIGLQGTLGWIMVRSGLSQRTEVAPLWLAIHLITAMVTLGGLVWTALDLRALAADRFAGGTRLMSVAALALALLFVQLFFGAITAGFRAGYAFNSWPLMGDAFFPAGAPMLSPAWRNALDNPIVVQFVHRWFAFVAAAGLFALAIPAGRAGSPAGPAIVGLVVLQVALGIWTLIGGVPIAVAVWHQANAALLLIAVVAAAHAVGRARRAAISTPL